MKRLPGVIKLLLIVWGALTLAAAIGLTAFLAFKLGPGNAPKIDKASPDDVRFVLNWCELGDHRIERMVHSYESARSITGDHLDVYAIKIKEVELAELTKKRNPSGREWFRGDQPNAVLDDAVSFVSGFMILDAVAWFPILDQLRSGSIYIYPWQIILNGTRVRSAQIIFVNPADKMVYYVSAAS